MIAKYIIQSTLTSNLTEVPEEGVGRVQEEVWTLHSFWILQALVCRPNSAGSCSLPDITLQGCSNVSHLNLRMKLLVSSSLHSLITNDHLSHSPTAKMCFQAKHLSNKDQDRVQAAGFSLPRSQLAAVALWRQSISRQQISVSCLFLVLSLCNSAKHRKKYFQKYTIPYLVFVTSFVYYFHSFSKFYCITIWCWYLTEDTDKKRITQAKLLLSWGGT